MSLVLTTTLLMTKDKRQGRTKWPLVNLKTLYQIYENWRPFLFGDPLVKLITRLGVSFSNRITYFFNLSLSHIRFPLQQIGWDFKPFNIFYFYIKVLEYCLVPQRLWLETLAATEARLQLFFSVGSTPTTSIILFIFQVFSCGGPGQGRGSPLPHPPP